MDKKLKVSQLEKEIKKFQRKMRAGDSAELQYDGKTIANYDFDGELSIDMKDPLQWLRLCLCFDIEFQRRDYDKVELKLNYV
jgi:hypothetical protein